MPWFFKRYVFFQRHAELEPLYHKDDEETRPVSKHRDSPLGSDVEKGEKV